MGDRSSRLTLAMLILFSGAFASADQYAGRATMNGFALKDFGPFNETWKMITVRYRTDTKEMRFTYANEAAAKYLETGGVDYPDGAVFSKIGFITEDDPSFKSSIVPSGAKRYQFMVRDKKKFAKTDGWGYVLFNGEGKTMAGEPSENSMACAACHRLVPDRGYVFSRPAAFAPFVEKTVKIVPAKIVSPKPATLDFKTVSRAELPPRLRRLLPESATRVRSLQGPLRDHLFDGTVNEIGPFLARESVVAGLPAILADEDAKLFAYAYVDPKDKACAEVKQTKAVIGRSIVSNKGDADETIVKVVASCGDYSK